MSRDKLLHVIRNNCIEKKAITVLFNKWHRRDELAAAKIIFGLKKTITCDYSYIVFANG